MKDLPLIQSLSQEEVRLAAILKALGTRSASAS